MMSPALRLALSAGPLGVTDVSTAPMESVAGFFLKSRVTPRRARLPNTCTIGTRPIARTVARLSGSSLAISRWSSRICCSSSRIFCCSSRRCASCCAWVPACCAETDGTVNARANATVAIIRMDALLSLLTSHPSLLTVFHSPTYAARVTCTFTS